MNAPNKTAIDSTTPIGWRWAPAWVLAYAVLWPASRVSEAVLSLGALAALFLLAKARFRDGNRLLSSGAWALTTAMFFAYWLPQLISTFDAADPRGAIGKTLAGLRYLPFLWLAASAVASDAGRRTTFTGLAVIMGIWTIDALVQDGMILREPDPAPLAAEASPEPAAATPPPQPAAPARAAQPAPAPAAVQKMPGQPSNR